MPDPALALPELPEGPPQAAPEEKARGRGASAEEGSSCGSDLQAREDRPEEVRLGEA